MGSKKRSKDYSSSESSDSSDSDSSDESRKKVTKKSKKTKHSKHTDSETEIHLKKHNSWEDKTKYTHKRSDNESKSRDKHHREHEKSGERDRQRETHDYRDKDRERAQHFNKDYKEKDYSSSKHRDYDEYERKRDDRTRHDNRDSRNDREYNRDPKNQRDFKHQRGASGQNFRNKRSRSRSFDHSNAKWGKSDQSSESKSDKPTQDKQKPNFGLSGKLTEETNTYKGVIIKYSEPPEARKPRRRWRLYPFKGEKALQTLYIHRESAYLIGRERKVVDLPVDHPSCSKQHAALQYRLVPFTREDGSSGKRVRPYLIDLDSANGTYINNKKIEPKKYVELLEKDVIKFGFSSREYVLLHENSKDEGMDDDVKQEEEEFEVKIKKEEVD